MVGTYQTVHILQTRQARYLSYYLHTVLCKQIVSDHVNCVAFISTG